MTDALTTRAQLEAEIDCLRHPTDPCPRDPASMGERDVLEEMLSLARKSSGELASIRDQMVLLELRQGTLEREVTQVGRHLDDTVGRLERVALELTIVQGTQKSLGRHHAALEAEHREIAGKLHLSVVPCACASSDDEDAVTTRVEEAL